MNETIELLLIRHAPVRRTKGFVPKYNPSPIINSNDFKKLAKRIPKQSTCYVSPLKRAVETAKELSKYKSFSEIIIDKNLIEQNFGDWNGKKISLVWKELKNIENKNNFSFINPEISPPNGDSFLDQLKRVSFFIDNLNFSNKKALVIITHSGTIRAFLSYILNIDLNKAISIKITYLSITSFEVLKAENKNKGGRFRLLTVNDKVI